MHALYPVHRAIHQYENIFLFFLHNDLPSIDLPQYSMIKFYLRFSMLHIRPIVIEALSKFVCTFSLVQQESRQLLLLLQLKWLLLPRLEISYLRVALKYIYTYLDISIVCICIIILLFITSYYCNIYTYTCTQTKYIDNSVVIINLISYIALVLLLIMTILRFQQLF